MTRRFWPRQNYKQWKLFSEVGRTKNLCTGKSDPVTVKNSQFNQYPIKYAKTRKTKYPPQKNPTDKKISDKISVQANIYCNNMRFSVINNGNKIKWET